MSDIQAHTELFHGFTNEERAVLNQHLGSMSRDELSEVVEYIKGHIKNTGRRNIVEALKDYFGSKIL